MIPKRFDLNYCRAALLRRKWYIMVPFFLIMGSGIIYTTVTPKKYKASTLILIQRQKVPSEYVRSNVTVSPRERINTIQQQVTSRTNLESIIKSSDLYAHNGFAEAPLTMPDKVERMRQSIQIEVFRNDGFAISFVDADPRKSAEIANTLASNFMQEHLKLREEMSEGTTQFLKSELARVEETLRQKEMALTAYKKQNMGTLPEDLDTNIRIMEQLNQKVSAIESRLDQIQSQKNTLEQQFANLKTSGTSMSLVQEESDLLGLASDLAGGDTSNASGQLYAMKEQLKSLQLTYTDKHPDVVKLRRAIEQLEASHEELEEGQGQEADATDTDSPSDMMAVQEVMLKTQLTALNDTTKKLHVEKAKLEKQIGILTQRIENAPKRHLELVALERDYSQIQRQYESLLGKKLQSQLAENLEKRLQGEQFVILDSATTPDRPFSPNVPRILLITLTAALAAGFGLAFTLEYVDQSFRSLEDLQDFLQMPALAIIPRLKTAKDLARRKRRRIFVCCISGCFLVALCIGAFLWVNGDLAQLKQTLRVLVQTP